MAGLCSSERQTSAQMRLVTSASRTLLLLAPSQRAVPALFTGVQFAPHRYEDLLAETQAFRGRIYLEDGAIKPWQLDHGRHKQESDLESWHLLVLDHKGHVCGCARYREYPGSARFNELNVSHSPLARSAEWGDMLHRAIASELELSRRLDCPLAELGGWALAEDIRGTAEALRMTVATYALTRELGGAIGLSTVTRRHGSASILRRMGGRSLEYRGRQLPAYYDDQYECEMEILRFYSWAPNPRYGVWIDEMKDNLRSVQVITNEIAGPDWVAAIRSRPVNFDTRALNVG